MIIEKIYFNSTDDIQLFGLLHKSEKNMDNDNISNQKIILSVHGMTSNCFKKREDIFAQVFTNNGFDYFAFNNRGANIMEYFEKVKEGKLTARVEGGTANERFEECYCDIKGAIQMLIKRGYKEIILQGHSYGAAKSLYTYNKFKENAELDMLIHIKSVILLSIVDVPRMCRTLLGEKYNDAIAEVKQMINENRGDQLIKREYFLHAMSAKNFLFFNQIGGIMDLVPFGAENPDLTFLNNIECPLLMIWGKERDLIMQKPEKLEKIITDNVKNPKLKVKFIADTGHNYRCKEKETAEEILDFLSL